MKIIYVNCGVKNHLKEDHRSYTRNLCSCEKKAIAEVKGSNRLRNAYNYLTPEGIDKE